LASQEIPKQSTRTQEAGFYQYSNTLRSSLYFSLVLFFVLFVCLFSLTAPGPQGRGISCPLGEFCHQ